MTIRRRDHGRGHAYYDDAGKVPGVTTLLNNGLPKPALINWAANTTADYAIDRWDELAELKPSERLKALQKCRFEDRDAAARRGTEVHHLAERLIHGESVEAPEEIAGHVDACVAFLDEWNVQPVLVEAVVYSPGHWYAGSLDLVADLADGRRWLIDYKTNRSGPFGDTAFQLAAYRHADVYVDTDGDERPMADLGIDGAGVVWLRADGYDLYPYDTGTAVFREFLYIAQVAAAGEYARNYKHDALPHPMAEARA